MIVSLLLNYLDITYGPYLAVNMDNRNNKATRGRTAIEEIKSRKVKNGNKRNKENKRNKGEKKQKAEKNKNNIEERAVDSKSLETTRASKASA